MSNPKLNIKEETSTKKTRSPPKRAKVEQTVPKKKKLKTDADKAAEKAQHLRFGKAELTPDELSRLSKAQKREMYAAHAARSAVHREIDQYEDDNVGTQALSESEKTAGNVRDISKSRYARKLKKKAKMQGKKGTKTARSSAQEPTAPQDAGASGTGEGGSNWLSRWRQKQDIRQSYYAAAHSGTAAQTAGGKAASNGASAARSGVEQAVEKGKTAVSTAVKGLMNAAKSNAHVLVIVGVFLLLMLKEGFYHRPLTVIRPIDIENFLKGMRRDGRSDSYISKARGMLYQIFQKAEANDLVRRNPVRLAEKMRASGTAKRKEAFTTAEVAHLMKVLPDDRMGLSIRLLLGTGMRMQELLALEPQFIEEDGSVIHIRQAVKVIKGTVSIGSPKSKDSIRDIPVPLNVRPCAIKLRDTTDQFIWESPKTGLPCNPTHFRDVFRKSLEEAGDVRLLTPHSCRHTYVSQMQALGVDIQTIQSIVGHADTEMTEHYLHVQESIRQSAIQLFSEAFSA